MLGLVTLCVIGLVAMWCAIFRPRALLFLYPASLPFFGVIAEIGVQITPFLIISLGMLLAMAIRTIPTRSPKILLPFLIYTLLITIFMSFFLPDSVMNYPLLRGQLRWLSQIIMLILIYLPIVFYVSMKPTAKEIFTAMDIFIFTMVFLCFTGIIQLIIFKHSGNDPFPINLFAGETKDQEFRSALSRISRNVKILRMSSLGGGEPKHFGYSCVVAFSLHILKMIFTPPKRKKRFLLNLSIAVLLMICVILTLSTQAYLVLGVCILFTFIFVARFFGFRRLKTWYFLMALSLGIIFLIRNEYINRLLEARLYERLEATGIIEDFNLTIIDFLKDQPWFLIGGTGLGNVHFWAGEYIPKEFQYYMKDHIFVAKAGFLRIMSEQGIIGLLLFLIIPFLLLIRLNKKLRISKMSLNYIAYCFLLITIINFIVTSDSPPYFILSFIFAFSVLQIPAQLS